MRKTCLDMVYALAQKDERVLFVGSDLGQGTLDAMKRDMPERWLMEGVSEQGLIGLAAGLALEGYVPYVSTVATFITRRCFEQVAVDLCLHQLRVRLIGKGGGLVCATLGPTHQAIEDMAITRALPNMTVLVPADADEMRALMLQTLDWPGPIYIRLAQGGDPIVTRDEGRLRIGKAVVMRPGGGVLFVSTGIMTSRAIQAADELERSGIDAGVLHVHTIKPFDTETLLTASRGVDLIVTVEEHVLTGGLGSAVLEAFADADVAIPRIKRIGLPDAFTTEYGTQNTLLESLGLTPAAIAAGVHESLMQPSGARLRRTADHRAT